MSTANLPKNNLVVFTPNNGHGHLGVICEVQNEQVKVYSFTHTKTFLIPANHCLPFRYPEDYETMCTKGYWTGVIIESSTKQRFTVLSGRLDPAWQDYELSLQTPSGQHTKPVWVHLKHITPVGHNLA